jgi:phosphoribosylformylglycinamidine synthase
MSEQEITQEHAVQHGLTREEFEKIKEILGRTPNFTELGIFSVMWSEHCSYKNSISELKKLPRSGGKLLVGAGEENAGLVDIGDGLAVCFKIESHNHPSAIEPYQGAATGVGGILRDIFTMGARPIAALNSLRFGKLDDARNRYLFDGVVKGIADYGNCFGVPTVSGEVYFEECYNTNPLVNAMAVGIVEHNKTVSAVASGEGNSVFIIGSRTGRDGIHGATFASEDLHEKSEKRRPAVQVGDPFTEKLLLEAVLEMIEQNILVGIQDMGAAGITCSTTEMCFSGKSGMIINLDKVPLREADMNAYEILLSESQERMLAVVNKGEEKEIEGICDKWDLICEQIGQVIDEPLLRVYHKGEKVAEIPPYHCVLGGGAPVYIRKYHRPAYLDDVQKFDANQLTPINDIQDAFIKVFQSPNIISKNWVFHQYDHMVQTNTSLLPGGDASVMRLRGTKKALSVKTDCNARYVFLNPRRGAQIAVAEAARNVICSGAKPLAITNCLNFGNPYKPEMFYLFKEAVAGMGDTCRVLNTPVTGGNVSFYNESPENAVYPTPVIGMLGLIEDLEHITPAYFQNKGDLIYLVGKTKPEIGGSELLKEYYGIISGDCPSIDLEIEKKNQETILIAIQNGWIESAHDLSDGGLAVALAESCIINRGYPLGALINIKLDEMRTEHFLFSESQSRFLLTVNPINESKLISFFNNNSVIFSKIGKVYGQDLIINDWIKLDLDTLSGYYFETIQNRMEI